MEGPEYLSWVGESQDKGDTLLMGANTYRLMSGFADVGEEAAMADLTAASKVVFSSTLEEPVLWANTSLVATDAVESIRAMKDEAACPLRTLGSVSLCLSLLRSGVVDSFRVVIFPVITGDTGRDRIFEEYPDVRLELVDSRLFDGRLQMLEYIPTVVGHGD